MRVELWEKHKAASSRKGIIGNRGSTMPISSVMSDSQPAINSRIFFIGLGTKTIDCRKILH